MYFKYSKPKAPYSELVEEKVYKYDYQFDRKEVEAMTWARWKVKFVNDIAQDWGGEIKSKSLGRCRAPVESTYIEDIARC